LREWEFKGNGEDSREVATDSKDRKQGSREKNKARAEKMLKKIKRINRPSMRQGGPYTEGEINVLWQKVEDRKGDKKHYSVHANTETGKYRVCERDSDGEEGELSDYIPIKNFAVKKSIVERLFPQ
jgi:hypothetical protein